jgi:outer membrane protein OmpA-like peptidoglycan-associated protein
MRIRTPAALLGVRGTDLLFIRTPANDPARHLHDRYPLPVGNAAARDLIVVLPGSDGQIGGFAAGGNKIVLDKAYAGARPGTGAAEPVEVGAGEVERVFAKALAARPIPPKSYTLYFESGGDEIVPESRTALDAMLTEVAERKAVEVVITGHTDTTGSSNDNDRLLDRARTVEAA